MSDERGRVLDMLRAGRITDEQADQLLRQLTASLLTDHERLFSAESTQSSTPAFASSSAPTLQQTSGARFTLDELIGLSAHDVDPAYVNAVHDAGYSDLPLEEVIEMHAREVDPVVLARFHRAGLDDLTVDEILEMHAHEVDPNYVARLRDSGYTSLPFEQLLQLAIFEVDPEYLKLLYGAGLVDMPFDTLLACSIHQVDIAQLQASVQALRNKPD
jgi:hypothetical protein